MNTGQGQSHMQNQHPNNEGRHSDDAALTDFLASLMDYTPTVIFTSILVLILFASLYSAVVMIFFFFVPFSLQIGRFQMNW